MTIIEVCQELDCDFRIIHEIPTNRYSEIGARSTIFKAPPNNLMWEHEEQHRLMKETQNEKMRLSNPRS